MVFKDYYSKTRELWSVLFTSGLEKIFSIVTKMSDEVVHTQANIPALAMEEIAPVVISLA